MSDDLDLVAGSEPEPELHLALLGRFELSGRGGAAPVPSGSRRLLALLALRAQPMTRAMVAGTLWPESSEQHASASLRSALTRLRGDARRAVAIADIDIDLSPRVAVDVRAAKHLAYRLLEPDPPRLDPDGTDAAIAAFSADLLPDWRDEWLRVEAAQWRQLRLHALDAMTDRLATDGRWAEALTAAQAAIRGEPLRETSHAALIRVLLAGGDHAAAREHFEEYRALLREELHLDPTPQIADLLGAPDHAPGRAVEPAGGTRATDRPGPPRSRAAPRRGSG